MIPSSPCAPRSRRRRAHATRWPVALVLAATAFAPAVLQAQFLPETERGRRASAGGGGIETSVMGRVGYDVQFQNLVVGALARATLPLPLRPTVQGSGDLTFFDGITDRGAGADLLLEVFPGIWLGGGPYWRNTVFATDPTDDDLGRETRLGWSGVVQLGGIGGSGRTVTGLEFRWVEVDGYNPQMLTLQFGIRLTGGTRRMR